MIDEMFGKDNNELLSRINYVSDTIIKDQNTKLGKIFNAIERIGYTRTALRAWEKSKETTTEIKTNLEWLTSNVFSNQIPKLIGYSKRYPAVALYLKENEALINDAFENISENTFSQYPEKERQERIQQFKLAKQEWQEYCKK